MIKNKEHISVCFCTYKRTMRLEKLIKELQGQETEGLFTFDIVAVDNDNNMSAKEIIENIRKKITIQVSYYNEPEVNIALARNKAVENSKGELLAFIDDDEVPGKNWLINLYKTLGKTMADGVLGPVIPYFEVENIPEWLVQIKNHERPKHKTGEILHWKNTRTGNVLFRKTIFNNHENLFRRKFGRGGEDTDFFKRMIDKKCTFVWCDEAPVYEAVTADRCTRNYLLKRAILRGQQPYFSADDYTKSFIAVPLYTIVLPTLFLINHYLFMKYMIKNCDHVGRMLNLFNIKIS